MNLYFRLLWITLFSRFRSKMGLLDSCRTPFRVWPTDLDVLRHMNNGKYCSLQDLARVDFMIRAGAMKQIQANGWYPVVVAETLQFRRSLGPFQKFELTCKVVGWDEKSFFLQHTFERDGAIMASGYIRARFLKKTGGSVMSQELLQACGYTDQSLELPSAVRSWAEGLREYPASF